MHRIVLSLLILLVPLSVSAEYTCTEAIALVDSKITLVRNEIKALKNNQVKSSKPNLKLNRIKQINRLIQRCYKLIDKSRVGPGKVKYSETDWLEDNPEADIAALAEPSSEEDTNTIEELKLLIEDLQTVKTNLEANDGLDVLCDFEILANPWIETIDFSDTDTNDYSAVILKFQRFASKNIAIFEKLPSSSGLIRDEFAPDYSNKAVLRRVVKRERKNRRLIYRLVIRIYRATEKLS